MNSPATVEQVARPTSPRPSDGYDARDFDRFEQVDRCEMVAYVPQDASRILDVGCAVGRFGAMLKKRGPVEVWGVEPNAGAANAAAKRLDRVLASGFTAELDLPTSHFDCVVFNDVLEHLVDPTGALHYARRLLKPRGCLVASIPNVRYFDNLWKLLVDADWRYTEHGILDRTHLRFFTKKSLQDTITEAGFAIETLDGINPLEEQHPHHSRRFKLARLALGERVHDMRYLQFAVVARVDVTSELF